jgi:hypothetical protein
VHLWGFGTSDVVCVVEFQICRHPSWGRCFESFGEDPELVKSMTDVILGLQGTPPQQGFPFMVGQ